MWALFDFEFGPIDYLDNLKHLQQNWFRGYQLANHRYATWICVAREAEKQTASSIVPILGNCGVHLHEQATSWYFLTAIGVF